MDEKEVVTMGYILPINHYQYQEYQNRIKGIKINNKRTIGIARVKRAYLFTAESSFNRKYANGSRPRKQSKSSANQVYAQMTGIGRLYDACI